MKPGPKPLAITDETRFSIKQDAAFGVSQKECAKKYGMSRTTFRKHCQKEFDAGKAWANTMVAKSLFWSATVGKNVTAGIWWEKTRAGYREPSAGEHAAANRPPPPALGISFEDGGAGRVRADHLRVDPENLDAHRTKEVGEDYPAPAEVEISRGQTYIPRLDPPKPTTPVEKMVAAHIGIDKWIESQRPTSEPSPAQADVQVRYAHEHRPLPDSICAGCRQMWAGL